MRRLLIILSVILLPGCALYDAYMMTGFDPNEYLLITQIRVDAKQYKTQCAMPIAANNAVTISYKTTLFETYSQGLPNNADVQRAAKSLNEIAQGLVDSYGKGTVNPLFCKLKYGSIENSAAVMQVVIGNRPR
jgi:hypothetical protein